ncbi:cytochrome P450 CYP72A219-like [Lycium ferocissimum]|uniref:cytochrome P450 CYP72A219-like n=1 Tax=Lycium ferocissimum TaxID=112874 RepID=UPI002815E6F9|nr:cytochrome P450 CYP72A219-like [Lycium ferocissimum]
MGNFYNIIAAILCGIIFLVYTWKVLNWAWFRPKKLEKFLRQQGLSGTSYRLLHGDLKELYKSIKEAQSKPINDLSNNIAPRIIPYFIQTISKCGKKCFVWFGPRPMIIIMESELIREIFAKNYVYQKPHHSNPVANLLIRGIANYEEDKWAKHRKILKPAFHMEKLKVLLPSFYLSCIEMLKEWEQDCIEQGSKELDIWPQLQKLTSDMISCTTFGSSYEEGRRIFELQKEQAEIIMKQFSSIYIPGSRFLPTKSNKKMKEIEKEVQESIRRLIGNRLKAKEVGQAFGDELLGTLLESNSNEIEEQGSKEFGLTIHEVIQECKLFYFAGQETTSVWLVWTMILLSRHQDWQEKAREEVVQAFGSDQPAFDEVSRLKIVSSFNIT